MIPTRSMSVISFCTTVPFSGFKWYGDNATGFATLIQCEAKRRLCDQADKKKMSRNSVRSVLTSVCCSSVKCERSRSNATEPFKSPKAGIVEPKSSLSWIRPKATSTDCALSVFSFESSECGYCSSSRRKYGLRRMTWQIRSIFFRPGVSIR